MTGYSLGVNAINVQGGGWQANIEIDARGGFSVGLGGVEVKAGGFVLSIGKKMGREHTVQGSVRRFGKSLYCVVNAIKHKAYSFTSNNAIRGGIFCKKMCH